MPSNWLNVGSTALSRVTNAYVVASALPERNPKPQAAATVAAASPRTDNRIFDGNNAKVIIVSPPVKLSQMPSPNGTVIFCAEVCAEISLGQYYTLPQLPPIFNKNVRTLFAFRGETHG
jgi:hypothetical protein